MPFPFYNSLSSSARLVYRRSAGIPELKLPDPQALQRLTPILAAALASGSAPRVKASAATIVQAIAAQLKVPSAKVRVLAVRPSKSTHELHGLYERYADGSALIRVWMRTAARSQVVAFRTFLRTLLHELGHHLDYELLRLPDSYHTEGFFQRESSLMRQLAPRETAAGKAAARPKSTVKRVAVPREPIPVVTVVPVAKGRKRSRPAAASAQLALPF